ncbi:hypothetical protein AMAG_05051 [Allomyces macrogynus ATCC 38327]|uniref:U1-type domain-containing protein n=1 Tax=Allomyces macrogynus (strain ATCC 38327) TaxID=578462 RepID=A0A0L0S757_ALLM3|nr:hypothetical protein AMAG_05051 [Allomyces macrogynus ATCC 38327]|eukprot:KNE58241.1 hypothetical protein AMAG_05051 [Allomyces macrogynus ATCC 38327]
MADYWRSKPKYWCKYCKIFVTDNKISRTHHESTGEHRRSMERFIAALAEADKEKKREEAAAREMVAKIEQDAVAAFAQDLERQGTDAATAETLLAAASSARAAQAPAGRKKPRASAAPAPDPSADDEPQRDPSVGQVGEWEVVEEVVIPPPRADDNEDVKPSINEDVKPDLEEEGKKRPRDADEDEAPADDDPHQFRIREKVVAAFDDGRVANVVGASGGLEGGAGDGPVVIKKRRVAARQTRKK